MKASRMALRLKRGEAPGLTHSRPLPDGTARYRWVPGPSLRKRGFKGFYLLGAPGSPISKTGEGWTGLGFDETPAGCDGLTVDGPPLDLADAIRAVQHVAAATRRQTEQARPAPRPQARSKTTAEWFDQFLEACAAGRVLKEQRGEAGRRDPIGAHTVSTYRSGLALLRPIIGPDNPRAITRADLELIFETLIQQAGWHSAVRAQRSLSRAFNWLRRKDPAAMAALPQPEIYTQLGLGQPGGRLRMATPAEAAAMFDALARPEVLAHEIARLEGRALEAEEIPPAATGAAAAWLFALWTCQRVNDVASATDHQIASGYFTLRQSKTGRPVHVPLLEPAREAIELARAARSGLNARLPADDIERLVFYDTEARLPYRQVTGENATTPGQVYFKRLNSHWIRARAFAGRLQPSLIGQGRDAFGQANKSLTLADSRDTGVTRLFEALGTENEARLAEIASWHGSSVENLLKLLKHYLVINPTFADKAGAALERQAKATGLKV